MKNGLLQPAIATGITNNLSSLQDTMSNLERIGNTPLPFAYQAHLRMSLWWVFKSTSVDLKVAVFSFLIKIACRLYLFFLPVSISCIHILSWNLKEYRQFQIYSAFKYLTIPGTAFASFLLLGFLEIGQEMCIVVFNGFQVLQLTSLFITVKTRSTTIWTTWVSVDLPFRIILLISYYICNLFRLGQFLSFYSTRAPRDHRRTAYLLL